MSKTIALCCSAAAALVMTVSCDQRKSADAKETVADQSPASTELRKNKAPAPAAGFSAYATAAPPDAEKKDEATAPPHDLTSAAAAVTDRDGMRFVRTADIRFQVRDVAGATYDIEDVTTRYGGFVTSTDLHSTVERQETVPISEDSSLEVTWYTVQNDITLRLPAVRMDSALRAMTPLVGFLDHRIIRADEVSGQLLAEALKQQRNAIHEKRMDKAMDDHQVKSQELTEVAENALAARERADDAMLASRTMENQIKYSTLHFVIYQHEAARHLRIANPKALPHYERPLLLEAYEALLDGWYIVRHVLVFVIRAWAFVLIGLLGYMAYKLKGTRNRE